MNMQVSRTITNLTNQKADSLQRTAPSGKERLSQANLVRSLKLARQLPIKPGREERREGAEKGQTVSLTEFSTWEQEEN